MLLSTGSGPSWRLGKLMRKFLIFAAIVGAIVLMAVLSNRSSNEALSMRMEEVVRGRVAASVLSSGTVNYRENIKLRTEVTGRIMLLNIEEGDAVKAGDILAVISPELFEADVVQQQALANSRQIAIERQKIFLAQLQRKQARQQELFNTGVLNTDLYENTERDVAMAKLDLDARRQDLAQTNASLAQSKDRLAKTAIRAPIDGIVTALNVKVGETVVAGTTNIIGSSIMDVSDPSAVLAEVKVEEADILAVKLGQEAEITMASAPDSRFKGTVISIGTTARADANNSNSFLVKLLVENTGDEFSRLAISCRAEILTHVVDGAVKVPVEAVLRGDDDKGKGKGKGNDAAEGEAATSDYVFVNEDGLAKKKLVAAGIQTDTSMEILSGLAEGETIIVGPYRLLKNLKDGQAVVAEKDTAEEK